jgi:hypothetical protein
LKKLRVDSISLAVASCIVICCLGHQIVTLDACTWCDVSPGMTTLCPDVAHVFLANSILALLVPHSTCMAMSCLLRLRSFHRLTHSTTSCPDQSHQDPSREKNVLVQADNHKLLLRTNSANPVALAYACQHGPATRSSKFHVIHATPAYCMHGPAPKADCSFLEERKKNAQVRGERSAVTQVAR